MSLRLGIPRARGRGTASATLARNGNFLLLWAGQFVSQMGDRLAMVALPWLAYQATGSALSTGAVFAVYTLPYVLFGAVAGVAIDRFNKRNVMVAADAARLALVLLVPWAAQHSMFALFAISFALASAAVFFDPSKMAIVPDLVSRDTLLRANSMLSTAENLTEIVGYGAAGVILANVSTTTAFRIDAASFMASAVALLAMRYQVPSREPSPQKRRSVFEELLEGNSYLLRNTGLLANTLMVVGCVIGLGASYPLAFLLAVRTLDGGVQAFGAFQSSVAIGYLVGALALATFAKRIPTGLAMTVGLGLMGTCLTSVSALNSIAAVCAALAAFGVANSVALIAVDTYLQETVPEHLRGRVWGTRFTLTQGAYALSVLGGGALAGVFDVRALFIVSGALIAIPAIAGIFVREIRNA